MNYLNKCFKEKHNIDHYNNLRKAFLESIHLFSREDKYFIFNDMLSWCILKQQEGNTGYIGEELDVIKLMLEHQCLTGSETEPMNIIFFRNVIFTALDLNELDWIENFITESINNLSPQFRENMRYYSFIYIEYHKKNFEKCMEYFSYLKLENSIFKRDLRILMLKVYYELNYYENALYLLDSTRHLLSGSREISQTHKLRDSNFTKFYKKLLKITKDTDASEIELLKKNILNEVNVESKSWLMRKTEEKSRR
ncbi:MAG TPA: hypothetical protein PKA90_11740 [Ignavibacteria bacterium]|nr:hypothetical protein [Ignavibacteria bacterium]HMR41091.1 hypothetical protein [Ignavibacteria bacterium]